MMFRKINRLILIKPRLPKNIVAMTAANLVYIAGSVRGFLPNVDVRIIDFNLPRYQHKTTADILREYRPDLVGITGLIMDHNQMTILARDVKAVEAEITVVAGGHHATTLPESLMAEKAIDYVIRQEGEIALVDLIKALESGKGLDQVSGLVWRKGDKLIKNDAVLIDNLDELPPPAWDLLPLGEYPRTLVHKFYPVAHLVSSRGCPFQCTFCAGHQTTGKQYRKRNSRNVLAEMIKVAELHQVKEIFFWDENFGMDQNRVRELCGLVEDANLDLKWGCMVRADEFEAATLEAMKRAGCFRLYFGIESGSQRVLDDMRKCITLKQITRSISLAKRHGFEIISYYIIGYPSEGISDILRTIVFSHRLGGDIAFFHLMLPVPGVECFASPERQKLIIRNDYDLQFHKVHSLTERISNPSIILALRHLAFASFYLSPKRLSRVIYRIFKDRDLADNFVSFILKSIVKKKQKTINFHLCLYEFINDTNSLSNRDFNLTEPLIGYRLPLLFFAITKISFVAI